MIRIIPVKRNGKRDCVTSSVGAIIMTWNLRFGARPSLSRSEIGPSLSGIPNYDKIADTKLPSSSQLCVVLHLLSLRTIFIPPGNFRSDRRCYDSDGDEAN